jgi:hypothetical protein
MNGAGTQCRLHERCHAMSSTGGISRMTARKTGGRSTRTSDDQETCSHTQLTALVLRSSNGSQKHKNESLTMLQGPVTPLGGACALTQLTRAARNPARAVTCVRMVQQLFKMHHQRKMPEVGQHDGQSGAAHWPQAQVGGVQSLVNRLMGVGSGAQGYAVVKTSGQPYAPNGEPRTRLCRREIF